MQICSVCFSILLHICFNWKLNWIILIDSVYWTRLSDPRSLLQIWALNSSNLRELLVVELPGMQRSCWDKNYILYLLLKFERIEESNMESEGETGVLSNNFWFICLAMLVFEVNDLSFIVSLIRKLRGKQKKRKKMIVLKKFYDVLHSMVWRTSFHLS